MISCLCGKWNTGLFEKLNYCSSSIKREVVTNGFSDSTSPISVFFTAIAGVSLGPEGVLTEFKKGDLLDSSFLIVYTQDEQMGGLIFKHFLKLH